MRVVRSRGLSACIGGAGDGCYGDGNPGATAEEGGMTCKTCTRMRHTANEKAKEARRASRKLDEALALIRHLYEEDVLFVKTTRTERRALDQWCEQVLGGT